MDLLLMKSTNINNGHRESSEKIRRRFGLIVQRKLSLIPKINTSVVCGNELTQLKRDEENQAIFHQERSQSARRSPSHEPREYIISEVDYRRFRLLENWDEQDQMPIPRNHLQRHRENHQEREERWYDRDDHVHEESLEPGRVHLRGQWHRDRPYRRSETPNWIRGARTNESLDLYGATAFLREILMYAPPKDFKLPDVKEHDGTRDPNDHIFKYKYAMMMSRVDEPTM
ncbi:hypothetical protein V2J09_003005 [Rumex salicifolius]